MSVNRDISLDTYVKLTVFYCTYIYRCATYYRQNPYKQTKYQPDYPCKAKKGKSCIRRERLGSGLRWRPKRRGLDASTAAAALAFDGPRTPSHPTGGGRPRARRAEIALIPMDRGRASERRRAAAWLGSNSGLLVGITCVFVSIDHKPSSRLTHYMPCEDRCGKNS